MKKSIALIPLLLCSQALAADPVRIAPTPITSSQSTYDWDGFYAGVNAGYGRAQIMQNGAVFAGYDALQGIMGGAQAGYNLQFGAMVLGVEADIQASHLSQPIMGSTATLEYFGTLRARLGVDIGGQFLPYLTAGIAGAGGHVELAGMGAPASRFHSGWTAGAGIEAKVSEQISIKAEYLHLELAPQTYYPVAGPGNVAVGFNADVVRAGVNFHF